VGLAEDKEMQCKVSQVRPGRGGGERVRDGCTCFFGAEIEIKASIVRFVVSEQQWSGIMLSINERDG
jgi:hypothetical protein